MQEKHLQIASYFKEIEEEEFYGMITFQFQKGIVQLVRKEETLKGSSLFSGETAEESQ